MGNARGAIHGRSFVAPTPSAFESAASPIEDGAGALTFDAGLFARDPAARAASGGPRASDLGGMTAGAAGLAPVTAPFGGVPPTTGADCVPFLERRTGATAASRRAGAFGDGGHAAGAIPFRGGGVGAAAASAGFGRGAADFDFRLAIREPVAAAPLPGTLAFGRAGTAARGTPARRRRRYERAPNAKGRAPAGARPLHPAEGPQPTISVPAKK